MTKTPNRINYITDGKDALFVELYDVDDMMQKIEFLLNNPPFRYASFNLYDWLGMMCKTTLQY